MADETETLMLVAADLVEQIKPLLAHKGPAAQGAALAELLAIWLTGHIVIGDRDGTRKLRADILSAHLTAVRQLVDLADPQDKRVSESSRKIIERTARTYRQALKRLADK